MNKTKVERQIDPRKRSRYTKVLVRRKEQQHTSNSRLLRSKLWFSSSIIKKISHFEGGDFN